MRIKATVKNYKEGHPNQECEIYAGDEYLRVLDPAERGRVYMDEDEKTALIDLACECKEVGRGYTGHVDDMECEAFLYWRGELVATIEENEYFEYHGGLDILAYWEELDRTCGLETNFDSREIFQVAESAIDLMTDGDKEEFAPVVVENVACEDLLKALYECGYTDEILEFIEKQFDAVETFEALINSEGVHELKRMWEDIQLMNPAMRNEKLPF
jgi:hypothetical protein